MNGNKKSWRCHARKLTEFIPYGTDRKRKGESELEHGHFINRIIPNTSHTRFQCFFPLCFFFILCFLFRLRLFFSRSSSSPLSSFVCCFVLLSLVSSSFFPSKWFVKCMIIGEHNTGRKKAFLTQKKAEADVATTN